MKENEFDINLIIDEYSSYVYKIINNLAGTSLTKEDKEEAISDTFFLLWKNKDHIETNLKAYLGTIARNVTYKKLKETKTNFELNENLFIENEPKEITLINEILDSLTESEYELFNLHYIKGYKLKEIAKLKNKSLSAIKMSLLRIRKKIQEGVKNE